jgi:hypothetical protein
MFILLHKKKEVMDLSLPGEMALEIYTWELPMGFTLSQKVSPYFKNDIA